MHLRRWSAAVLLLTAAAVVEAAPATCVDGQAGGFECQRVDLVARLDTGALGLGNLNDIWGWTDPVTGTEYALIGGIGGTAFVDLSDPENPVLVGRLPAHDELAPTVALCATAKTRETAPRPEHDDHDGCGSGSAWRDLKVHADHVFVVSEAANHGMQVFDLNQLRDVVPGDMPVSFDETAHYAGFGNAHNLFINEATGIAYAVGSNTFGGGPHFVDVSVPALPVAAGGYAGDGYSHDIQCVTYAGPDARYTGREICFGSNTDTLTVLDVTDHGAVQQVSRTGYAGAGYTHQAWLTADQAHLFMGDELDELNDNLRTRRLVWDLADLQQPVFAAEYRHPGSTIDHNNYVHGGHLYESNYTAGLAVLDARDPLHAFEIGFFDTHPADDLRQFDGTWSNYPFFASGLVAVSDITGGLFVLRPHLPDPGQTTDLGVTLEALTTLPDANDRLRLRITVANLGLVAAPEVMVSLGIDAPLSLLMPTVTAGGPDFSCETTVDLAFTGSTAPRCRIAMLAPAASVSFEIEAAVPAAVRASGTLDATAIVGSGALDSAPVNNQDRQILAWNDPDAGEDGDGGGGGPFDVLLAFLLPRFLARRRRA